MEKTHCAGPCRKLLYTLVLAASWLLIPSLSFSQASKTVTGTIRDGGTSQPLEGATVAIKGTTQTTSTNSQGSFTISVPGNNSVLVISHVGYTAQEILVGENSSIEISLQAAGGDLGQVVVVGYGTQRKKDVTGAVKSLKADDFNKGIVNNPQQLLQGKV